MSPRSVFVFWRSIQQCDPSDKILFIGTSLKSRRLTKFIGKSTQNPYVQHRWTKGFLTNWESISTSIKFFNLFLKKLSLSKKGEYNIRQEFEGLSTLKELPSALFFIDLNKGRESCRF